MFVVAGATLAVANIEFRAKVFVTLYMCLRSEKCDNRVGIRCSGLCGCGSGSRKGGPFR